MTIPAERTRAVLNVEHFLLSLVRGTPRIPKEVREMARQLLRHYPSEIHLEWSHRGLPDVWGKP